MTIPLAYWLLITVGQIALGYLLGRERPARRLSDWANWQRHSTPPTGWRYAATWTVLSIENLTWLITHPVQGWHAWQHRNDPPPPRSPAVTVHRVHRAPVTPEGDDKP